MANIELTEAQERIWRDYQSIGTPEEIRSKRSSLESDNRGYREKLTEKDAEISTTKQQLTEAKKSVPEGGVVLDATQAKAWTAYQELGKPEDLKAKVTKAGEIETKLQGIEHQQSVETAAATLEWNPDVLKMLPGVTGSKIEIRKEKVDGHDTDVAYITEKKEGAVPRKLEDRAQEADWKPLLPSLEHKAEAGDDDEKPAPKGAEFVRQQPSGKPPKKGPVSQEDVQASKRASRDYAI